ncbi:MAG TPA: flippase-like domain-containing protein [Corynebacteriales bacterium]|nr:flippase-like domain-containing protein [Mycobacteriales bacterium]
MTWLGMLAVLGLIAYFLYTQTDFIKEALLAVKDAHPGWVIACIVASFASMLSFAGVQWTLLRAAGVNSPFKRNVSIVFASNALSGSVPGGPVLGTALTYRETKRLGATTIIAAWQLVVSGVLATVGLALLGLGGFVFLGTTTNPVVLVASLVGLFGLLLVVHWAMKNPEKIEDKVLPVLVWWADKRHKDPTPSVRRLRTTMRQMKAVELQPSELAKAFGWSLFNWITDIACMGFAAYAVGARPSIAGMSIAYVTGKIVGSAPVTPGGLGTVDGALVWALTISGLTAASSLATVLIYRLISFLLMILIGWILVVVLFQGATHDTSFVAEYEEETEKTTGPSMSAFEQAAARHRRTQEKFDRQRAEREREAQEAAEIQQAIDNVRNGAAAKKAQKNQRNNGSGASEEGASGEGTTGEDATAASPE